ncbi:O-antigen ligase family protein [Gordoniibacillus kamchatkensis]|uniref:O-antigen ligase family protein n=1 Tax=Gordoniibacillus kamchatkensis TaxID=1590651 RepID=UPI0018CD280D|nr:O-antigen ligase family protein [Paenibacillus sp. VKM B-2647]
MYPYLIFPFNGNHYYADSKVYYFIGFVLIAEIWKYFSLAFGSPRSNKGGRHFHSITRAESTLAFLIVLIGCSSLLSHNISLIGNKTEHQGFIVMLAYVILFATAARFSCFETQKKTIFMMIFGSILPAIYGILQHFGWSLLPQDHNPGFYFGSRSFSLFDNPDYFGSYLALLLLLTITFFLSAKGRRHKILFLIILCALYVSLLYSETRSAWLGSVVGFVTIVLFVVARRRHLWRATGLLLVTFVLIFAVINASSRFTYSNRAKTIANDAHSVITNHNSNTAGASRWYIWKASLPLIKEHFWLGSGPNTFRHVFHPGIDPDYKKYIGTAKIYDANNDYLQIALTMGVPTLIVYLLFLFMVLHSGFKKARMLKGDQQIMTYGMLAAIVGYLVQAFFNISVVSVAPYFWLLLGFVYSRSVSFEPCSIEHNQLN